ncbi:hypothetical protein ABE225_24885 [Priestia megaterium]
MLDVSKIRATLEENFLQSWNMESKEQEDGYITTYGVTVNFSDDKGEFIGDLIIYFKVIGFGIEEFDGGVDTYFHIPCFSSGRGGDDAYFEDVEAFRFIFTHFGEEVQNVIDVGMDMLYDHYEEGSPLGPLFSL